MNATLINCIIALLFTLSKSPFLPLWLGCSLYQEHRSRARCVRSLIMTLKHEVALLLWAHTAMKFPFSSLPHCIPFWSNVFVYTCTTHQHRHINIDHHDIHTLANMKSSSLSFSFPSTSHIHMASPHTDIRSVLSVDSFLLAIAASFRLILLCKMGAFQRFILNYCHEIRCNFRLDVIWKYFCCLFISARWFNHFSPLSL